MGRPAFTLIELMIATTITCVIAAGTYMFFSGSGSLSREAYKEVSAVMSDCIVREKEIFRPGQVSENACLPCSNRVWEVAE